MRHPATAALPRRAARRPAPSPSTSACLPWPSGTTRRSFSSFGSGRTGSTTASGFPLRAQAARHRRIARQVEPLEHGQHRRQRHLVDVAAVAGLALAAHPRALDGDPLQAGDDRHAERVRDADPDLVAARVRRLVPEQDQVERLLAAHRLDDRARRRLRVPLPPSVFSRIAAVGADRHAVAQLLLRLRRAERQHDRLAAVRLDEAHGLLHRALLVRADREAEVLRVDRLLVRRQHHAAAGERHPLHADEQPHERILSFSGSKIGVEPTTSTVTGKSSFMYSTASRPPAIAYSGGR